MLSPFSPCIQVLLLLQEHTPDTQALESQAPMSPLTVLCTVATEGFPQTELNRSPEPHSSDTAEDRLTPLQAHSTLRLQLGQDHAEHDVRPDYVVAVSSTAFRQPDNDRRLVDLHADQADACRFC